MKTNDGKDDTEFMISVIMGIYNCQNTLGKAIDSIISQTYQHWELIMCDDGSTDRTYEIAEKYRTRYPEKIILLRNVTNQGLNITLNKCFHASKGELIARQDADDISLPERFQKQVDYLLHHPECSFVSCGMNVNNGTTVVGARIQEKTKPTSKDVLLRNQFYHATLLIRREALEAVGGYSEERRLLRVEDYNLYSKLYAAGFTGDNIMEVHYEVLEDDNTYRRRKFRYRINRAYAALLAVDLLGFPQWYKIIALRGMIIGLLPSPLYRLMHRKRLASTNKKQKAGRDNGGS